MIEVLEINIEPNPVATGGELTIEISLKVTEEGKRYPNRYPYKYGSNVPEVTGGSYPYKYPRK